MSAIAVGGGFGPLQKTTLPGTESRGAKILKSALIGGAAGLAAGVGVSLLTKILPLPIAAAIGGVAGLALGALVGFLRSRNQDTVGMVGQSPYIQSAPPIPVGVGTGGLPPQHI